MLRFTTMANSTSLTPTSPWSQLPTNIVIFLSALNIILCITASLGNTLILIALKNVSSICPPTKLLFRFLAVTDLCVGLISHPLSATFLISISLFKNEHLTVTSEISLYAYFLPLFTLPVISVLSSAAISVDRLLALLLRVRYRHVVTLRRVRAAIVCSCSIGILCGAVSFTALLVIHSNKTIVLFFNVTFFGSIILALVTSTCCYTKIFFALRRQQAQLQGHFNAGQPHEGGNPLNIARYKNTVLTLAWVQLALSVCYAPFIIMTIRFANHFGSWTVNYTAFQFVTCLVNLNSSLNPILYCWRIRDVRQQVKNILRKCAPCSVN